MASKTSEISAILKYQIKNFKPKVNVDEVGVVVTVGDGIALVSGLQKAMLGELLEFANKTYGLALSLEEEVVGVVILGETTTVKEDDKVRRTGKVISVPVGDSLVGRVINPLAQPLDGMKKIVAPKRRKLFRIAPGVMTREEVNAPLETGIISIDSMIPIGKGQRELIIGDRQTGKTAIAIDTILNQKGKNVHVVYVAIGQKNSSIAQIVEKLRREKAMEYTTVVCSTASQSAPLQYLSPFTGVTIAEEWMEKGKDVLVIYDDLSKHAVAYRTLSLLLRRPPGREAYPGDIFYLHSQLLERAAKVNKANGGGSITALPIIETQAGDISAYIPTNVISITDGQIFTKANLFYAGQRPAVDPGYSVSRVGSSAQIKAMKQVSASLKLELAQYNEMASFAQFGSDLDNVTKKILSHGEKVLEIIKQKQYKPIDQIDQCIVLLAVQQRLINPIPKEDIAKFKRELISYFGNNKNAFLLREELGMTKAFNEKLLGKIHNVTREFVVGFLKTLKNYQPKKHDQLPDKLGVQDPKGKTTKKRGKK